MQEVYIALGSNLGNRKENIQQAIEYLKNIPGIIIDKISSLIETKPFKAKGPDYLNGVIKIKTLMTPEELLGITQDIEKKLGRKPSYRNAPRPIDLDIILFGDKIINTKKLKIPHPRMKERVFVMQPLLEIEPEIEKKLNDLYRKY